MTMQEQFLCSDCPRKCCALRNRANARGWCRSPSLPVAALAAPHFGEEPCISGQRGSGAIFFCGCGLRCVFCQNREISRDGKRGTMLTVPELRQVMLRLRDEGVHNINLVTATHYVQPVAEALRELPLGIPVVWNSSGYERVEAMRRLEGRVQIYLPDFKFSGPELARRYARCPDYPDRAAEAIAEMYRQVGPVRLDADGMMQGGVLIRHLMLPGALDDTLGVIDRVSSLLPRGGYLFSLMRQYTPMNSPETDEFPELAGTVSDRDYDAAVSYMRLCGIEDGFVQERGSTGEAAIPVFDGRGLALPS